MPQYSGRYTAGITLRGAGSAGMAATQTRGSTKSERTAEGIQATSPPLRKAGCFRGRIVAHASKGGIKSISGYDLYEVLKLPNMTIETCHLSELIYSLSPVQRWSSYAHLSSTLKIHATTSE